MPGTLLNDCSCLSAGYPGTQGVPTASVVGNTTGLSELPCLELTNGWVESGSISAEVGFECVAVGLRAYAVSKKYSSLRPREHKQRSNVGVGGVKAAH